MDPTDATLLTDFAKTGSESAFASLVHRYLPMVYGSALRQLNNDSALAADIAQSVFIALARKTPPLPSNSTLAPWLHKATRLAVLAAHRADQRRVTREQQAISMQIHQDESLLDWETLRPVIDEALDELNARDREAILLAYFHERSHLDLSAIFGCSENAARMRLARALEKLRKLLGRRGLNSTTAALTKTLGAQPGLLLPAGLIASVTAASLSAAVSTTSTIGILTFMASLKTKTALGILLLAGASTPLLVQHNENTRLSQENELLRVAAAESKRIASEKRDHESSVDRDELARLRAQQVDLARLRAEVTALRQENQQLKAAAIAPAAAKIAPTDPIRQADFIPAELWANVGFDTPERAFQSFLSVLKTGDSAEIASTVHFDVKWKDEVTEDDKKLVEKSMQDYLQMLERARTQLNAFQIASVSEIAPDRQRISFSTATNSGEQHTSSFEMINIEGQWKPVLSMRWLDNTKKATFATSPVFGPKIDLEQEPTLQ